MSVFGEVDRIVLKNRVIIKKVFRYIGVIGFCYKI